MSAMSRVRLLCGSRGQAGRLDLAGCNVITSKRWSGQLRHFGWSPKYRGAYDHRHWETPSRGL